MSSCKNCQLCLHASNQMFPGGVFNPDYYFVSSAPSVDEMSRGYLDRFSGNAARFFFSLLKSFDIMDSSRFFYLVRCTPFNTEYPKDYVSVLNTTGASYCSDPVRKPTTEELNICSKYLLTDIQKNSPKILITLGRDATGYFLGRSISSADYPSYVGKVYNIKVGNVELKLVPQYSLKEVYEEYVENKKQSIQRKFCDVLNQIVCMSQGKWVEVENTNKLNYAMSYAEFKQYYDNNLIDEYELAYDIETNAAMVFTKDFEIIGFSLAKRHEGIYVCLQALDHKMSDEDIQKCKDLLVYALQHANRIVVHNCMYEMPATRYNLKYEIPIDKVDDTMVMAKLMLGGRSGAGLKPTAQAIGYPDWETDLSQYIDTFMYAMKRFTMATYREAIEYIENNKDSSFKDFMTKKNEEVLEFDAKIAENNKLFNETGDPKYTRAAKKLSSEKEKLIRYVAKLSDVQSVSDTYETLLRKYYDDEKDVDHLLRVISQLIFYGMKNGTPGNVIPYHWIPCRLLNKYGATDSIATLDIKYDFLRQFEEQSTDKVDLYKGYQFMLKEYYAGHYMMMASMHWDDLRAKKDREIYHEVMLRSFKIIIKHPVIQDYIVKTKFNAYLGEVLYENYNDLLWNTQHHRVGIDKNGKYVHEYLDGDKVKRNSISHLSEVELTPAIRRDCSKRILKKLLDIANNTTDVGELKSIFNPASTIDELSTLINKALLTPKTRFCIFLKNAETAEQSDNFNLDEASDEEKVFWSDYNDYKSVNIKDFDTKVAKFDALMKKYYLAIFPEKSKGLKNKDEYSNTVIRFNSELMQYTVQTSREFKIVRFDDNAQIAIYEALLQAPVDPNNFDTWDFTFKWLFNFRCFKKAAKMVTTYIDGSVGRSNVFEVQKQPLENGDDVVIREIGYYQTNPEEVINSTDKDYLYQTNYRVCFAGDTRIPSLDNNDYTFKELIDKGIKTLWIYATNKQGLVIPAKAINPRLTRYGSELVEVIIDTGESIKCTPDHKFRLQDMSYKEAKDLIAGDNLMTIVNRLDTNSIENLFTSQCTVVEVKKLNYREDVYDMEVPGYANFAVYFGKTMIIAHNCSAASFRWQCLEGKTRINLIDGRTDTLENLFNRKEKDLKVLSYDILQQKPVIANSSSGVHITGRDVPILKITLNNGETIRCTPEHRIMLSDGTYKEAQYLTEDDELMNIHDKK